MKARLARHFNDSVNTARSVGLVYSSDERPGITRTMRGKIAVYRAANGKPLRDRNALKRIASLVIPPAWRDVWICRDPRGHIQAVGRDQRGRKQYRYHPRYREQRDQDKYAKMIAFVKALPRIRRRVARDLRQRGLPRNKVLAAAVRLLEKTLIRVGNEDYARTNHHYGLTTLHNRHASVRGQHIHFHFKGKSGVERDVDLEDPKLATIVRRCQDLPGEELFGYIDDKGKAVDVTSTDVNEYLREISGEDFTAKDFRTWAGTILAAAALREFEQFDSTTQAKKNILRAIESVASRLGNTKAVCRKCYIHPAVLDSYLDGSLSQTLAQRASSLAKKRPSLNTDESAVLALLRRWIANS